MVRQRPAEQEDQHQRGRSEEDQALLERSVVGDRDQKAELVQAGAGELRRIKAKAATKSASMPK